MHSCYLVWLLLLCALLTAARSVTYQEYEQNLIHDAINPHSPLTEADLDYLFRALDVNQDGTISLPAFRRALNFAMTGGYPVNAFGRDYLVRETDSNGDHRISHEELLAMRPRLQYAVSSEWEVSNLLSWASLNMVNSGDVIDNRIASNRIGFSNLGFRSFNWPRRS